MLIRQLVIFATYFAHVTHVYPKKMEGYIVNGVDVNIEKYPHSVFLAIECFRKEADQYACGGSIINQHFVLTAGHCYDECDPHKSLVLACIGATSYAEDSIKIKAVEFKIHEEYNSKDLKNDIGLIKLQTPMKFNSKVQRVYLPRNPPVANVAKVAGWGLTDEKNGIESLVLKEAVQKIILPRKKCVKIFGYLPPHTFCASSLGGYAAEGDSGSALVVHKFVQIGIVSYKDERISVSVIVYANASVYYDWIHENMRKMACR